MAKIIMENMEFYGFHGHYAEEQLTGGRYGVDIVIDTNDPRAIDTDDLNDTIDYSAIYGVVRREMAVPSKLIEHLTGRILRSVRESIGDAGKITVKVSKLSPPVGGKMESFSVVLEG